MAGFYWFSEYVVNTGKSEVKAGVGEFSKCVQQFVGETIHQNMDALTKNLKAAARKTRNKMRKYDGTWIGWHDMGFSTGVYASGWTVYNHRKWRGIGKVMSVVAAGHEANLTWLLENGHRIVINGVDTGKSTSRGKGSIEKAYQVGLKALLETCHVDNP